MHNGGLGGGGKKGLFTTPPQALSLLVKISRNKIYGHMQNGWVIEKNCDFSTQRHKWKPLQPIRKNLCQNFQNLFCPKCSIYGQFWNLGARFWKFSGLQAYSEKFCLKNAKFQKLSVFCWFHTVLCFPQEILNNSYFSKNVRNFYDVADFLIIQIISEIYKILQFFSKKIVSKVFRNL